mgnify:CR=1 FL=1
MSAGAEIPFVTRVKSYSFTISSKRAILEEFSYENANTDPGIAAQIAGNQVANGVDLICAIATPAAQASYNAAEPKGIPVIYTAISDPVAAGLATEENGAGLAVTGTSDLLPLDEQVAMIRQLMPEAQTIGVLDCLQSVQQCRDLYWHFHRKILHFLLLQNRTAVILQ